MAEGPLGGKGIGHCRKSGIPAPPKGWLLDGNYIVTVRGFYKPPLAGAGKGSYLFGLVRVFNEQLSCTGRVGSVSTGEVECLMKAHYLGVQAL